MEEFVPSEQWPNGGVALKEALADARSVSAAAAFVTPSGARWLLKLLEPLDNVHVELIAQASGVAGQTGRDGEGEGLAQQREQGQAAALARGGRRRSRVRKAWATETRVTWWFQGQQVLAKGRRPRAGAETGQSELADGSTSEIISLYRAKKAAYKLRGNETQTKVPKQGGRSRVANPGLHTIHPRYQTIGVKAVGETEQPVREPNPVRRRHPSCAGHSEPEQHHPGSGESEGGGVSLAPPHLPGVFSAEFLEPELKEYWDRRRIPVGEDSADTDQAPALAGQDADAPSPDPPSLAQQIENPVGSELGGGLDQPLASDQSTDLLGSAGEQAHRESRTPTNFPRDHGQGIEAADRADHIRARVPELREADPARDDQLGSAVDQLVCRLDGLSYGRGRPVL